MTNGSLTFNYISYERFLQDIEAVAAQVEADDWRPDFIVGIGRGGLVPGTFMSHRTGIALLSVDHSSKVYGFADALLIHLAALTRAGERYLFVDDINDSGKTISYLRDTIVANGGVSENIRFAVLVNNVGSCERVDYASRTIDRSTDRDWFVFPWEAVAPRHTLEKDAQADPGRLGLHHPET